MAFNIVELVTIGNDDCACDQPCRFGNRVETHAVYCHNDNWQEAPRKCRRTWYTGGTVKDEDCPGFEPNPEFKDTLAPTPTTGPVCEKCHGGKRVITDRGKTETCPLCCGSGSQPQAVKLTKYEQNTLECGHLAGIGECFVRVAETDDESESIEKLEELNLIVVKSISRVHLSSAFVYLIQTTGKGEAVMRANMACP